jgi:hypothetical protein
MNGLPLLRIEAAQAFLSTFQRPGEGDYEITARISRDAVLLQASINDRFLALKICSRSFRESKWLPHGRFRSISQSLRPLNC